MELILFSKRLQKLVNMPTFKKKKKKYTKYNENLTAVSLENKVINVCKTIYVYIGFAVFDISK